MLPALRYDAISALRIIESEWRIESVYSLDRQCLAALAMLSKATNGQVWVVECLLVDEMMKRQVPNDSLQLSDVVKVIKDLYKEAFAAGSIWEGHASLWEGCGRLLDE
jgi:hypothetical protein